jgi:thioredoxin-like negative regulator of GroEL
VEDPVVVEFWSPACDFCERFEPLYQKLANNFKDKAAFLRFNVTGDKQNLGIGMGFGVRAIPTLKVFYQGKNIGEVVGELDYEEVFEKIGDILENKERYAERTSAIKECIGDIFPELYGELE